MDSFELAKDILVATKDILAAVETSVEASDKLRTTLRRAITSDEESRKQLGVLLLFLGGGLVLFGVFLLTK